MDIDKKYFVYYTLALVLCIIVLNTQFSIIIAQGSSMTPLWSEEPTILLLDTTTTVEELSQGDIVSYKDQEYGNVTHRVYNISDDEILINGDTIISVERTYKIQEFKNKLNGKIVYSYDIHKQSFVEPHMTEEAKEQLNSYNF